MNDIGAHIAGFGDAEQGVQVGAIEIEQCPALMEDCCNFDDRRLKNPHCVRVGHHQRGDFVVDRDSEVALFPSARNGSLLNSKSHG